jgi:putative transposase
MSNASFYKWRSVWRDSVMINDEGPGDENRRLKKMYAEMSMQAELLKEANGKSDPASPAPGSQPNAVARHGVRIALAC